MRTNNTTNPDEEPSDWVEETSHKIQSLANLPHNWDGYGSAPPSPGIISAAKQLFDRLQDTIPGSLPRSFVCPVGGGGIQIEVATDSRHLELTFDNAEEIIYLKEEDRDGKADMDVGELSAQDVQAVRRLLRWLVSE